MNRTIRFHGLSLGIELRRGGKDVKLIRPLHWFQRQRALRRPGTEAAP